MWSKLLRWYDLHCVALCMMSWLAVALMFWGGYVGYRDGSAANRLTCITVYTEHPYIADVDTEFLHTKDCVRVPAEEKCIYFNALQTAVRIGYRPCGICAP